MRKDRLNIAHSMASHGSPESLSLTVQVGLHSITGESMVQVVVCDCIVDTHCAGRHTFVPTRGDIVDLSLVAYHKPPVFAFHA